MKSYRRPLDEWRTHLRLITRPKGYGSSNTHADNKSETVLFYCFAALTFALFTFCRDNVIVGFSLMCSRCYFFNLTLMWA